MITAVLFTLLILCLAWRSAADHPGLVLTLRRTVRESQGSEEWRAAYSDSRWDVARTAAIVCDMWDHHWCRGAEARVGEIAPRMDALVAELRRRGVLIVHSPSDTMEFYHGHPGRAMALAAPPVPTPMPLRWANLDPQVEPPLPIDDSDGGCDDDPPCPHGAPWTRQIAAIEIQDGDAIGDGPEVYYLMRQRGIANVLIMGVHENMCVLGRPFGIRNLVRLGLNAALVRDMTDTMYNPRSAPHVDHFTGTDLVTWHIEKYWCPTVTSDQIVGGKPFRFAADTQTPRVFSDFERTMLPR